MSFFQVDDKFHINRKVVDMIDEETPVKAAPAVMLWTLAGSYARDSGLDGVLTLPRLTRLMGSNQALARRAAAMLVQYGLWHAPGHGCEQCPPVEKGSWLFHQWFQFKYSTGAAERSKTDRGKELRDGSIVEAVWARDTDSGGVARCRYCATEVKRPQSGRQGGARRGNEIGQLDHVDPTKAIGATNIVVACPSCNQRKAQRTPEAAGMNLLPPPPRNGGNPPKDQDDDQNAIKSGSSQEVSPTRARTRGGAGGVGAGVGLGGGPAGQGVGEAGIPPTVPVGALFGSPWRGHHGPPPPQDFIDQATCPEHHLDRPCRACAEIPYQPQDQTEGTRR
ncbi:HNH endonuclease [Oerskovia jenensis]|uniref:HNH endonuclease n=1 Tax=Oerskovia jenensis TaxID=162169 RepID=UPI0036DCA769